MVFNHSGRHTRRNLLTPIILFSTQSDQYSQALPDKERAVPETLASIQSSSQYVYESTKSREAENYSDFSGVPT